MILATVGTHSQGFERLVRAVDELAAAIDELVIMQYGCSIYRPHYARGFDFETGCRMTELTTNARVVITHAAAGAVILALLLNKPLVLVPRLKRFGEHFDDHQLQLAKALHVQRKAVIVERPDVGSLRRAVELAGKQCRSLEGPHSLINALQYKLAELESTKKS